MAASCDYDGAVIVSDVHTGQHVKQWRVCCLSVCVYIVVYFITNCMLSGRVLGRLDSDYLKNCVL